MIDRALCDLGASINLMFLICGMVEDVVMRVEKLLFPIDFIVLDMPKDVEIPIIFCRFFLATSVAFIDVSHGVLTLRVQDEMEVFHMLDKDEAPPSPPYWTGYQVQTLKKFKKSFFKRLWEKKPTVQMKDNGKQMV
ncbi:Uncharacterized protein Adt_31502 [Abeliophyllum distichum]|uniref:Uncharacterized protein n=1 Tax=Abeliophyllum distichum TaxID=126358 RepID=A0ABD1RFI9_9LAMI